MEKSTPRKNQTATKVAVTPSGIPTTRSFRQRQQDECDDEFSEDQFDGHNDIGDDSSAENGMDRGNSVENVSLGSLQAERVCQESERGV